MQQTEMMIGVQGTTSGVGQSMKLRHVDLMPRFGCDICGDRWQCVKLIDSGPCWHRMSWYFACVG